MSKPIFVLAGQSNASNLSSHFRAQLAEIHGADGFVLVEAFSAGAPLTRMRDGKADWQDPSGLRATLTSATADALRAQPDGFVSAVFWIQGEGDTYDRSAAQDYTDEFRNLMDQFRTKITAEFGASASGMDTAKVVISALAQNAPAAYKRAAWDDIKSQHGLLGKDPLTKTLKPEALAKSLGFPAVEMFGDDLHYSADFASVLSDHLIDAAARKTSGEQPFSRGTAGDDVLVGINGSEILAGSAGNDLYRIDSPLNRIVELVDEGIDTVLTSVSFSLREHSPHLEDLVMAGASDLKAMGNARDNVIHGNAGNNVIDGGWGDDTLFGGDGKDDFRDRRGADHMEGGAGDDTYRIDHIHDTIVENPDGGRDRVNTKISFFASDFGNEIEVVRLIGSGDLVAKGNAADNVLRGNRGDNALYGKAGDDFLAGYAGSDVLSGGAGQDRLIGGTGADVFQFSKTWGQDVIDDFHPIAEGDRIDLSFQILIRDFDQLREGLMQQIGRAVRIEDGAGNTIILRGTDLDDLSADHFLF